MTRILLFLLVPLAVVSADTIKLKSGEVIEGKITRSDKTTITIETQFSSSITDERRINRSDIVGAAIASGDEAAFAKIRDIQAPATAFDSQPYEEILNADFRPFLKQFPGSTRVTDVKAKIKAFEADIARIKGGDVKVAGAWYDSASFAAEKYQVEAAGILAGMKREYDALNFPAAMNDFDVLQHAFQNSVAYADSIALAKKSLDKLTQQLNFTIGNLPQTQAIRRAAVERTPPEQRAPIQRAIEEEDARAAALAEAAQRKGKRFFAILPYDENGLKAMQQAAEQAAADFKLVNKKKLADGAKLVRQVQGELDRGELDGAATTMAQLQSTWPEYEGLGRLQQRLKSAQDERTASVERETELRKASEKKAEKEKDRQPTP